MSLQSLGVSSGPMGGYASVADIVSCFEEQRPLLEKLALIITGDELAAAQCVESARESTLKSHSPFRQWIFAWAKTATIQIALLRSARLIRSFEEVHKSTDCDHLEHLAENPIENCGAGLRHLVRADVTELIANMDPLCRAVLVLRLALGSSFQECAFRLNVSRLAVLGANCRAMVWLSRM